MSASRNGSTAGVRLLVYSALLKQYMQALAGERVPMPSYQDLSKEQDSILNLALEGSHLVTGPPGTGKTVMAIYRTQALAKQHDDKAGVAEDAVATFHSWFYGFWRKTYGETPPSLETWVYDWPEVATCFNTDPPEADTLPYLVIDEGQDLPKEFYPLAGHMAAQMTVFADENQRISESNSLIEQIRAYGRFDGTIHELRHNYRNTRQIAAVAAVFATSSTTGMADPPTKDGDPVVIQRHAALDTQIAAIRRFEQAHPDLAIGVFTRTKKTQRRILGELKEGDTANPVQSYAREKGKPAPKVEFARKGITVVNYPSTKGLEFDAVFIPEMQQLDKSDAVSDMQLYVLMSRARSFLFLAWQGCDDDGLPAVLAKIQNFKDPDGAGTEEFVRWEPPAR